MKNLKSLRLTIGILLVSQMSYAQWATSPTVTTSPIYHNTFQLYNDGVFQSTLNSNGVAKMDMGFTTQGYVDFTLHTGSGQRPNVLHLTGDGHVGVGTGTPAYKLDVTGDINIASGQAYRLGGSPILSNPGSGNVFVGEASGLIGISSTFVGFRAGANNTYYGVKNTFIGLQSGLLNENGYNNTFLGGDAGYYNLDGSKNVFVGVRSGYNASNGYENTFVGNDAGYSNVDGYANTFVGYQSGYQTNAPTGHDPYGNSFFGHQSGFSNTSGYGNVFMGKSSAYSNQSGNNNIAIGNYAGYSITSGGQNVIVGGEAGISATSSAADNVMVGYNAGNNTNGNANCYIGKNAASVGSDNVLLGASASGAGVGSGTVEGIVAIGSGASVGRTYSNLNMNGSMAIGYNASSFGLDNSTAIGSSAYVTTANTMALGGTGSYATTVVINQTGSTSPTGVPIGGGASYSGPYQLEVNGDAYMSAVWCASDERLKKEVEDFKNAKEAIKKLHPVKYQYRDDVYFPKAKDDNSAPVKMKFSSGTQIGFLAQELEEVFPEMVLTRGDGFKNVNYNHLFGVLVQGFKEQDIELTQSKELVVAHETKITALQDQNTQLLSVIDALTARLDALEQRSADGAVNPAPSGDTKTAGKARLEQNEPNPFTDNTVIKYFVPQTAKVATIIIRSDLAQEVMKFSLEHKGNGNIIVSANTLTAGGYNCELYVDGQLADSKRMILVK